MTVIHPGRVLREVYMNGPWPAWSVAEVAARTGLPASTIDLLLAERLAITQTLAVHLARIPTTTVSYWLGLQDQYETQRRQETGPPSINGTPAASKN